MPFEIDNEILKLMLQRYGEVYKCQNYFRKFGKYKELKKTGVRIIWMKINEHIPESLKIKQTQINMYVCYQNQLKTCNKCGISGHIARNCRLKPSDFKNVIDINKIEKKL